MFDACFFIKLRMENMFWISKFEVFCLFLIKNSNEIRSKQTKLIKYNPPPKSGFKTQYLIGINYHINTMFFMFHLSSNCGFFGFKAHHQKNLKVRNYWYAQIHCDKFNVRLASTTRETRRHTK